MMKRILAIFIATFLSISTTEAQYSRRPNNLPDSTKSIKTPTPSARQTTPTKPTPQTHTKRTASPRKANIKTNAKTNANHPKTQNLKALDSTQSRQTKNLSRATKTSSNPISAISSKSNATAITLSSIGGSALAGGLGGGIYALTKKGSKDSTPSNANTPRYFSPNTVSIGMVDSGYDSKQISQPDKNFYDLGVTPPSSPRTEHGTNVAKSIRKFNKDSKMYMYSAGCGERGICTNTQMFNQLYAHDAKVINGSWGRILDAQSTSISIENLNAYYSDWLYYGMAKEAASQKRIFVFAAGNDSSRHANIQSSIPIVGSKATKNHKNFDRKIWENAKRGWIAVTATARWNNLLDTRYANWIGEDAKNWGIAVMPNNVGIGTSFSAPVVSAVVANVWNRFPWMNNHLVTQTILTTADKYTINENSDIYNSSGDKWHNGVVTDGPNKKTGWGILNESRALKGPARFDTRVLVPDDAGKVQINFAHQNYEDLNRLTFSNDIAGDAGLHKMGSGILYMSGSNTYTGETHIDDGGIVISNALLNSSVTINTKGTLQTQNLHFLPKDSTQPNVATLGTLNTNYTITNYGTFAVYKDTVLNGSYISKGDSTLALDVDAKLDVKGSVDMSGGQFALHSLSTIPSATTQTKTLLTAQNGVNNWSGTWSVSRESSAFLKVSEVKLSGAKNDLEVAYRRDSTSGVLNRAMGYAPQNLTNIGVGVDSVLNALESQSNAESNAKSSFYTEALSLMSVPLENAPDALASLSGEVYDSSLNVVHRSAMLLNRTIARRLYQISLGDSSGVWADVAYAKTTLSKEGFASGDISQYTLIAGLDGIKDNKDSSFGGGLLLSANKAIGDFGIAGKSDILSYGASLYALASYKNFYGLVRLGASLNNAKTHRKLNFGTGASFTNKQGNFSYHGYIELGFNFKIGIFGFTPFIAWEEDILERKKVEERADNASNFALTLPAKRFRTYSAIYGAKGFLNFGKFSLEYSALNLYAPKPTNFRSSASFRGADSISFTSSGISQARNLIFLSIGASYTISSLIFRGEYSTSLNPTAKSKIEDKIFNFNVRYGF